jgi:exopolysaccharide biosynthesis polyprenyl glycosylphosphotransferase
MEKPLQINFNIIALLLFLSDIVAGILSLYIIKTLYTQANVILPQALSISTFNNTILQYTVFTSCIIALIALLGFYRSFKLLTATQNLVHFTLLHFISIVSFTFFFFTKNETLYQSGIYNFFLQLFSISLLIFIFPRFLYYLGIWWLMKMNKIAVHALLIGNNSNAQLVYDDFAGYGELMNYHFIGYVSTHPNHQPKFTNILKHLGSLEDLQNILSLQNIDEVIVAIENNDFKQIETILTVVKQKNITIRILPDLNAILEGNVKMHNIKGIPLLTIRNNLMPVWQNVIKFISDYLIAATALIISLPIILIVSIIIKLTTQGPIFFSQIRIGKNHKPFVMYKFRTMQVDAEANGPALSSSNDPRITPIGKILRKWHIDEIPQFVNILKGEMSMVGPRPEREYFINQIVKETPYYSHLFRIKPGITSWGMVKYGYAENVAQMIERSKYDIIYLENMTLLVDLKIIAHTIKAVFVGNGK